MAVNNFYPSPYGNPYNTAGMGMSNPYNPQNGVYQPNPYNYAQGQNMNATPPQIGLQQQAQQQQNNSNVNWIYVPNIEAAKQLLVTPNQTAYIMNQNEPIFYVKSVNEMGVADMKVCPFSMMSLAEFEKMQSQMQAQAQAQNNAPVGDFVPRSEFNQFVNNVSAELQSFRQSLLNAPQNAIVNEPMQVAPTPAPATKSSSKKTKENTND